MSHHAGSAALSGLYFPVNVRFLPPGGVQLVLATNARERAALAAAHDVAAVLAFSVVFQLRPWKKQGVRVEGQLSACIEQPCSITAEPLQNTLHKHFEACFVRQNSRLAKLPDKNNSGELFLDPEGEDMPEIFSGDEINVGALAEEFFELEIDRYPRRQGAFLQNAGPQEGNETAGSGPAGGSKAQCKKEEHSASPFAVLTHLKKD
ncbi:DUF177 domain-containing protein [Candidatus Tokpelaia sp.]|uniref:DUF177 domain-containing protein n=1 Tax=Candidatus Tokpelaia sp. TaxID=2233777 RepID=UPI00123C0B5F|nr:DUF177 domain-containing protein [Candidatus Tokpelaia sp.]KAA6404881.1 DUF177 domain-containing protein [Candidatus Tokpelaia sp.]